MRTASFLLLFLFFASKVSSQMICESLLKDAQSTFDAGNYDGVLRMLEEGLSQCNFSNAEKERAIILMIYSQIQKDNPEATDKLVYRLLKLNPNYTVPDPEVVSVYNSAVRKYEVHPAFILGVQVGFNFPFSHIQKVYSILDGADYSKKYTPQIGVVSGLHMEWVFMPGLSINADPTYSRSTYSRDITGKNDWKLNYSETFVNYDISGMIRYTYNFHTVRLSVAAGYQYLRIDKAFADLELNSAASTTSGLTTYPSYQLAVNKIDMIQYDLRKRDFGFWVVGAGIAYQTDNFIFSLDARYAYSNKNIVNSEKRYANNQLVMDYFYTDNDFDISRVEARAGVAYILGHKIRPRKIK